MSDEDIMFYVQDNIDCSKSDWLNTYDLELIRLAREEEREKIISCLNSLVLKLENKDDKEIVISIITAIILSNKKSIKKLKGDAND